MAKVRGFRRWREDIYYFQDFVTRHGEKFYSATASRLDGVWCQVFARVHRFDRGIHAAVSEAEEVAENRLDTFLSCSCSPMKRCEIHKRKRWCSTPIKNSVELEKIGKAAAQCKL